MSKNIFSRFVAQVRNKFVQAKNKNIWYHLFFWMVVLVVLIITERNRYEIHITLVKELVNVGFFAIVVYFNLYFL